MEEFPRSLQEFDEQFAPEQACRDYLFRLRWSEGFRARAVRTAGVGR
jgi:hypothetical protein